MSQLDKAARIGTECDEGWVADIENESNFNKSVYWLTYYSLVRFGMSVILHPSRIYKGHMLLKRTSKPGLAHISAQIAIYRGKLFAYQLSFLPTKLCVSLTSIPIISSPIKYHNAANSHKILEIAYQNIPSRFYAAGAFHNILKYMFSMYVQTLGINSVINVAQSIILCPLQTQVLVYRPLPYWSQIIHSLVTKAAID